MPGPEARMLSRVLPSESCERAEQLATYCHRVLRPGGKVVDTTGGFFVMHGVVLGLMFFFGLHLGSTKFG